VGEVPEERAGRLHQVLDRLTPGGGELLPVGAHEVRQLEVPGSDEDHRVVHVLYQAVEGLDEARHVAEQIGDQPLGVEVGLDLAPQAAAVLLQLEDLLGASLLLLLEPDAVRFEGGLHLGHDHQGDLRHLVEELVDLVLDGLAATEEGLAHGPVVPSPAIVSSGSQALRA
jgi:hypothetical protein